MINEPEWRDANPETADLPNKGRAAILCIAGGLAVGALAFVAMRIRPVGLSVGTFAFISGITMLLRKRKINYKPGIIITIAGFLMLLGNPRFGIVAGFAGYFLVVGALGLVVVGLFKAVKLSWDLGKRS